MRDKLDPTSKCDIPLHRHGPDPTKVRVLVGDPDSDKVWSGPPSGIWMTIPLSYDSRPLVYCSRLNQQAHQQPTARFRHAGLWATSDTRLALYSLHFLHTNGCNNKILQYMINSIFFVLRTCCQVPKSYGKSFTQLHMQWTMRWMRVECNHRFFILASL